MKTQAIAIAPDTATGDKLAETKRIPERRAAAFAEASHSLVESGSGVVSSRCPASGQSRSAGAVEVTTR